MFPVNQFLRNIAQNGQRFEKVIFYSSNSFKQTKGLKKWTNEIQQLEANTRFYGRVDLSLFQNCLTSISNEDITPKEGLLLLKCCGPLMYNANKLKRTEYLKKVWNLLRQKRVPLNVMHYNLLIKMYLENDHDFDAEEVLNELRKAELEPSLRTYEFVFKKFCIDGKLEKANEFLEQIIKKNHNLTSSMFDSLILGHFIRNDIRSALETFKLMKESGFEESTSTFKNIVIGYLKNYQTINAVEEIKHLLVDNAVKFDIDEFGEIIDQMPEGIDCGDDLKEFLIECIYEKQDHHNELPAFCYHLSKKGEYRLIQLLFKKYFQNIKSQDYFINCMINLIIESREDISEELVRFLKELHPSFDFSSCSMKLRRAKRIRMDQILKILTKPK